ncbi:phage filamentation protein Fil family protein [Erwinia psidii]|uniref:DUF2724 domain-containing protein n=1 Tax=Erwinia psidii TaxID=69224 RepID=A0A3N6SGV4_9GAMM|nr:phage filamentation protein Fil family protein [Erwinia psidii]RQM39143.1 hypothetical protein EB241_05140 [Erwinia psidii]
MYAQQCPSLSAMLVSRQQITHRQHTRGWIETPDGRYFLPDAVKVQFVNGFNKPFICRPHRRWFARLMGIFA